MEHHYDRDIKNYPQKNRVGFANFLIIFSSFFGEKARKNNSRFAEGEVEVISKVVHGEPSCIWKNFNIPFFFFFFWLNFSGFFKL
jgi:outer membrane protein assembly factor BamD (BamD/ComL family)